MHVKLIYPLKIESWETRADGSASSNHAVLEVKGRKLILWSALRFVTADKGAESSKVEMGIPETIVELDRNPEVDQSVDDPRTHLLAFMEEFGRERGLLRFDIDGETIWQTAMSDKDDLTDE